MDFKRQVVFWHLKINGNKSLEIKIISVAIIIKFGKITEIKVV